MQKPSVWTIAGFDPSAGAGLQADLLTFHDFGVQGFTIATAIAVQNSLGVSHVQYLDDDLLLRQIHALKQDLPAPVIKLGMQGHLSSVIEFLHDYTGQVVVDHVMYASSGHALMRDRCEFIRHIIPRADLVTPNTLEAEQLTGIAIKNYDTLRLAAEALLSLGAKRVYLKGGHFPDARYAQDYFSDGKNRFWLVTPRLDNPHRHGSGCTFSAAVAAALAHQRSWSDAVVLAKKYVQQGIRLAKPSGAGRGAVAHAGFPLHDEDLPYLTDQPLFAKT